MSCDDIVQFFSWANLALITKILYGQINRLSARREQHSLNFPQSLPNCSRTSKLLPPCRGEIHGRQLRNKAKLTQPRACTNRYVCSPIPYYVELINSKLP